MRKIILQRPKERFNKTCSYQITVGNKVLADLKNGEERTVEIPNEPEHTTVKANIYWCGSEKMKLAEIRKNEKVVITGNEFLNRKLPLLGALFPMIGIVIFNDQGILTKSIGIGILLVLLIGLIGTLTFGRNKWLKLEKVKATS